VEDGLDMYRLLLIFIAGGSGCLLRYGLGGWMQRLTGGTFPVGTLAVNLIGCLAIGFLAALFTGPMLIREEYRVMILVGLLGGFTTFSSFAHETVMLLTDGQLGLATLNVVLSNGLGLAGAWLGARLAVAIYGS
jgi:fluoride exporter